MKDAEHRAKRAAIDRINAATGAALALKPRNPYQLPDGRNAWLLYNDGTDQAGGHQNFWVGTAKRPGHDDWFVMILRSQHLVIPAAVIEERRHEMTRSSDGRPTPHIVGSNGHFECRIGSTGVVLDLDPYKDAYGLLNGAEPAGANDQQHDQNGDEQHHDEQLMEFKPRDASDYQAVIPARTLVKTRTHEALLARFAEHCRDRGFCVSNAMHPRDLVVRHGPDEWLVEAKVLQGGNATRAVRDALAQLLEYQHFLYPEDDKPHLLAVFNEPVGPAYVEFLARHGIASVWPEDDTWLGEMPDATS